MPLGDGQLNVEVCCFCETPRNQGREVGICHRYLRIDRNRRRQVAYGKRVSPRQTQDNVLCAMIPERMSYAHLEWSRQSEDMNPWPRSIEGATRHPLHESMRAMNRLKEPSEKLSLPLKSR